MFVVFKTCKHLRWDLVSSENICFLHHGLVSLCFIDLEKDELLKQHVTLGIEDLIADSTKTVNFSTL